MNAIWCHTPTDVWAVGLISVLTGQAADTIAHWDGTVWSPVAAPAHDGVPERCLGERGR